MIDPPTLEVHTRIVSPVALSERIVAIDILRGVAILGILVMNIQSFSMPLSAYTFPWSWGEMTGANAVVYYLSHLLASGKFISIFAMLFGAGIILQNQRLASPQTHVRRMLILIGFGLLHAYLFWYGDILFSYGVLGLVVFLLRSLSIRVLCAVAGSLFFLGLLGNILIGVAMHWVGSTIQPDLASEFKPSLAAQLAEIDAMRGTWPAQLAERAPVAAMAQTFIFFIYVVPFVAPMMLAGMALMKSGFYTGSWPRRRYARIAISGCLLGWTLSAAGLFVDAQTGHDPILSSMVWNQFNTLAMFPVAIGYSAAVILLAETGWRWLSAFAAVGRTALSCYLLETLLCTTLFYGFGFGLFGSVERTGQIFITVCLWIVLLMFASLWTRFFRYGPAEWLWRKLTYGPGRL